MSVAAPVPAEGYRHRGVLAWTRRAAGTGVGFQLGAAILCLAIGASAAMHVTGLGNPYGQNLANTLAAPSWAHPFGTDEVGRDVFQRTVYATLLDVQIGAITAGIPLCFGLVLGAAAGYFGRWFDAVVMRLCDLILAVPLMVLVLAIVAAYGPGLSGVYVGLVVKGVPYYVRLTRSEMLGLRERQFMLAAQTLGFRTRRVLARHALPHLVATCLVFFVSDVVGNILVLAALSYLGLGVQPPTPEWGAIIAEGQVNLLTAWWVTTLPGVFVVVIGVAMSLTGEGLAGRLRLRGWGMR